MTIEIRLFATLRQGRGKILKKEFPEGTTIQRIMKELGIPQEDIAILLLNGRDAVLEQQVRDGDAVSVFPPVGGG